jgi:hypothetical protein
MEDKGAAGVVVGLHSVPTKCGKTLWMLMEFATGDGGDVAFG